MKKIRRYVGMGACVSVCACTFDRIIQVLIAMSMIYVWPSPVRDLKSWETILEEFCLLPLSRDQFSERICGVSSPSVWGGKWNLPMERSLKCAEMQRVLDDYLSATSHLRRANTKPHVLQMSVTLRRCTFPWQMISTRSANICFLPKIKSRDIVDGLKHNCYPFSTLCVGLINIT